ncbi:TfuA-like protein [Nocardia wallacei]|uniref:TfuA-like protein n=1 Tax=Nocardia wallacei TaxID=480035 RepID=UPI002457D16D|nr:TfuA-like protein [Nocardia wallacei]
MIAVYAGPSLPVDCRPNSPELHWYPPAERGDLDRFDAPEGTTVVLVDGYMIHRHPPSPTEVHGLVRRGYVVWGCASLGALRAAELRHHGVQGFGWVYDRVVDRTVTYDDELVAMLDPRTDKAATLFLVNLRYGLEQLTAAGRIDQRQAEHIIDGLRSVYFEHRTSPLGRRLAIEAGVAAADIDDLLTADIKQRDARALIERLTVPV